ncbi:DSS1/SEM1 family-domain-containing protein [Cryomyces antarcticus]|uniref:26S proteasome complex subunit SEM1 n=1 Tax=Cryomyces minteri TaxID=331657 RepID=A0A4U0WYC4_9PEZI|nr:26S proteasome complex subunit [Oleoguttula sp. CCFEE 6159]TKA68814.1 putative 26S proteasome complex subunit sem-1 [Cryomyces minteri]
MSGSGSTTAAPTTKATVQDTKDTSEPAVPQKPAAALEEDDEFEDFPVEDWTQDAAGPPAGTTHLWEESWDDDDTSEDFAKQLKEELAKVNRK